MDCDFSHDPADVPRLIAAAEDADLVLGSRYVAGGGDRATGASCGAFVSRGGSLYAQVLLGVGVRDLTGGFKCYRRDGARDDRPRRDPSRGYAFQIETTYRALRAGFRVVEVPIAFADREAGGSKMSRAIVLEAIWRVPGAAPPGAGRPPVASTSCDEVTDATLRGGGPAGRPAGRRRLLGAVVRPVPRGRADPRASSRRSTARGSRSYKLDIDENPTTASRYGVLSIPTAILFEAARRTRRSIGARPRSHYEQAWAPWLDATLTPCSAPARGPAHAAAATARDLDAGDSKRTRGSSNA